MATTNNYYKIKHGLEAPSQDAIQVTESNRPTIRPSLNLNFAQAKVLDPRITFSRASTATYYDGKTTAKGEENLFKYSQTYSDSSWTKFNSSIVSNSVAAPDGTTTATTLTANTTNNGHNVGQLVTLASGNTYTITTYAKKNTANYVSLFMINTSSASAFVGAAFDLVNGTVSSSNANGTGFAVLSTSIVSIGNGWYRCSLTGTHGSIGTGPAAGVSINNDGTTPNGQSGNRVFTGTGTESIYIWGTQLEQRDRATAYTPTTTSAITNYVPVLQTAATNTARFDHDPVTGESKGLLIEEQRTNLLPYSQDFDAPYWATINASIVSNCAVSPNGTFTAGKIVANTVNNQHVVYKQGIVASGTHTLSVYAKAGEHQWLFLSDTLNVSKGAWFNLSNGTIGTVGASASATITSVGNGWHRCTVTITAESGSGIGIYDVMANGSVFYSGDGYSGIYIWGAQIEAGAFPTSYIPTTLTYTGRGSTGTYLAVDGLIRTAAANVQRYNANEAGGGNLLLEGASTNLSLYSNDPAYAVLTGSGNSWALGPAGAASVSPNAGVAPDGSFTANRYVSTSPSYFINYPFNYTTLAPNAQYVFSCWVKSNTSSSQTFMLAFEDTVIGFPYAVFTATPEWKRFYYSTTSSSAPNANAFRPSIRSTGTNVHDILVWGCQLELGTVPTSYIPTTQTHTGRSSTATYYDSTGIVRTAASGQPRYTYNPSLLTAPPKLLLEAQATNLILLSTMGNIGTNWQQYNTAVLTSNYTTAPDGSATAGRITTTTAGTVRVVSGSIVTTTVYAASIWVKSNTSANQTLVLQIGDTNVVNITATPQWQRFSGFGSPQQNGYNFIDLENIQAGADISVWGAQLETGYGASSYIATGGSSVTRAADTATSTSQTRAADIYSSAAVTRSIDIANMTGSNLLQWYNPTEGTLYAEGAPQNVSSGSAGFAGLSDGNSNNSYSIYYTGSTSTDIEMLTGGSVQSTVLVGGRTPYSKIAAAYATNNNAAAINGITYGPDTSVVVMTGINTLVIGGIYNTAGQFRANGPIKKISYYPKRLSNAELANITS